MQNFEMTFTDHIEATRRAAELVSEGVTAKYVGLWDGLYIVEYQANERLPERTVAVTPPPAPVEMQYINRRAKMPDGSKGDGALWPTFCPILSEGWEQIGAYPIEGRHEAGDTVLVFSGVAKPEIKMTRSYICEKHKRSVADVLYINFSKGDHLTESEREAWHQEATGFQESYYSTFQK